MLPQDGVRVEWELHTHTQSQDGVRVTHTHTHTHTHRDTHCQKTYRSDLFHSAI